MAKLIFVLSIMLIPISGLASEFQSKCIGGGGWLHSGAFHPQDEETIIIGTDHTGGIYRTNNSGESWDPWNEGLPNSDGTISFYVEDLLGVIDYEGPCFYAATQGGMYRAADDGSWDCQTLAQSNYYTVGDEIEAIPFSCLVEEDNNLFAGAGRVRWERTWDIEYYPGIATGIDDACVQGIHYSQQYPVWTRSLAGADSWSPVTGQVVTPFLSPSLLPQSEDWMGTPRDISAATIDGVLYVAICTPNGIYVHNGTEWMDYCVGITLRTPSQSDMSFYPGDLTAWSIHLTERGTLYAAMQRISKDIDIPGGVYFIPDINSAKVGWYLASNEENIYPDAMYRKNTENTALPDTTMGELGLLYEDGRMIDLIYLTVVDGSGPKESDTLYLGDRRGNRGLFIGKQPPVRREYFTCEWTPMVYWTEIDGEDDISAPHFYHVIEGPGQKEDVVLQGRLDNGWVQPNIGMPVLFHPVVCPHNPNLLLTQFNARLHHFDATKSSEPWTNVYCYGGNQGPWKTRGYDELCIRGLGFTGEGRLLYSVNDMGAFQSTDATLQYHEPRNPPIFWGGVDNEPDPPEAWYWNYSVAAIHGVPDSEGTDHSQELVLSHGLPFRSSPPGKLSLFDGEDWHNITPEGVGLIADNCIYPEFQIMPGSCDIYLYYIQYVEPLESDQSLSPVNHAGLLIGTRDEGEDVAYTWVESNIFAACDSINDEKGFIGTEILFHEEENMLLFTARNLWQGKIETYFKGGLFTLDLASLEVNQIAVDYFSEELPLTHFFSLAQSADDSVVYAGTGGTDTNAGVGTVLKCLVSDGLTDSDSWQPLVNHVQEVIIYDDGLYLQDSCAEGFDCSKKYTHVEGLAVDPSNPDIVYVGIYSWPGFFRQEGVWRCDSSGDTPDWQNISELSGVPFQGVGVQDLMFSPYSGSPGILAVGTDGQGVYTLDIGSSATKSLSTPTKETCLQLAIQKTRSIASTATVSFSLSKMSPIRMQIFDVRGRVVYDLTTQPLPAGTHDLTWAGENRSGRRVASGVYFLRLSGDDQTRAQDRITLVR